MGDNDHKTPQSDSERIASLEATVCDIKEAIDKLEQTITNRISQEQRIAENTARLLVAEVGKEIAKYGAEIRSMDAAVKAFGSQLKQLSERVHVDINKCHERIDKRQEENSQLRADVNDVLKDRDRDLYEAPKDRFNKIENNMQTQVGDTSDLKTVVATWAGRITGAGGILYMLYDIAKGFLHK